MKSEAKQKKQGNQATREAQRNTSLTPYDYFSTIEQLVQEKGISPVMLKAWALREATGGNYQQAARMLDDYLAYFMETPEEVRNAQIPAEVGKIMEDMLGYVSWYFRSRFREANAAMTAELQQEHQLLQEQYAALQASSAALNAELQALRHKAKAQKKQIATLQQQLAELAPASARQTEENDRLRQEVAALREAGDTWRLKSMELAAQYDARQAIIDSLQEALSKVTRNPDSN